MFLTGDKPALHHLAADGLKFVVADKKPGERDSADDLFIHTTKAVLVDKQGRIRKWFSTEEENSARDIVRAAKALAKEPGNAP
jgi:cytochrome oxidase Cu insertion factor (SCO1/SenC/PrrC family)